MAQRVHKVAINIWYSHAMDLSRCSTAGSQCAHLAPPRRRIDLPPFWEPPVRHARIGRIHAAGDAASTAATLAATTKDPEHVALHATFTRPLHEAC